MQGAILAKKGQDQSLLKVPRVGLKNSPAVSLEAKVKGHRGELKASHWV